MVVTEGRFNTIQDGYKLVLGPPIPPETLYSTQFKIDLLKTTNTMVGYVTSFALFYFTKQLTLFKKL